MDEILALLENENLTAAEIAKRLGWTDTKVYAHLIRLEARGALQIWIKRSKADPEVRLWCKCEVFA